MTESNDPGRGQRTSHPPSEPRPSRKSFAEASREDRPLRLQLFGALFVPFVLVAVLLYLWRRPRVEDSVRADAGAASASAEGASEPPKTAPSASASAPPKVKVGEVKVLSCQDTGKKKTPPEQCDHLATLEQGLVKAIEASATCLPDSAGAGTVEYALDISFSRKKSPVTLTLPRAGRTFKNGKVVIPCAQAVRAKTQLLGLDGVQHTHARYKISVIATYNAP